MLLHLDFVLVLVLIGGQLGDLLLPFDTVETSLESVRLVSAGLFEALDARLPLELLAIDLKHDLTKALVRLIAILLGLAQLLVLGIEDVLLVLERFLQLL